MNEPTDVDVVDQTDDTVAYDDDDVAGDDDQQVVDQTDDSDDDSGDDDADADGQSGKSQGGNRVQKRISKLTKEKYELKARAELAEKMLMSGGGNAWDDSYSSANADQSPQREDFDSDDDYEQAAVDYRIDQRVNAAVDSKLRDREASQSWGAKKAAATKTLVDYDEVIEESTTRLTPAMEEAILTSDIGPHVAYYLAKNVDEANGISSMSPVAAIRAIGKIEAKLTVGKGKRNVSGAPAPVKPVGGGGAGSEKDPEKMSQAEYEAWRMRQIKKQRGG